MKLNTPSLVALYLSSIAAIVSFVSLLILAPPTEYKMWLIDIIAVLVIFLLLYPITIYVLNRFFIKTLQPVYKTIKTFNFSTNDLEEELESSDYSYKLQNDVKLWATEKTKQIARLRQMEKYRKEFLGDVSHELRTPIFTVQGYISALIDGGIYDENINMKYLERSEKSINRMISIVEDLMAISKLESGELLLCKTLFDIYQLVEEVIESVENKASKKAIELQIEKSHLKNYWVRADRKMIYQVLSNLIVNSINYGKENGTTKVRFYDMAEHIMIEVVDNGMGIKETDIPRIFERFYRADKSHSKETGGTGLGLAICKHIMEAHHQKITVNSEWGKGTSFSFMLDKSE